jgi:predicted MPP superfamily phosphohydrolase
MLYNLIMIVLDVAALRTLQKSRRIIVGGAALAGAMTLGMAMTLVMEKNRFGVIRLAVWCLFFHGVMLTIGAAVLLWRKRRRWAIGAAVVATGLVAVAIDSLLIEPTWLDVSHYEIASPKLRRRCRIVVIADLQTDSIGDYERDVLRRVVEAKPDMVLFAGDYFQDTAPQTAQLRQQLNALLREMGVAATARTFAVQGNCDFSGWTDAFRGLNITTVGATQSFDLDGMRLTCLSLDDSFNPSLKVAGAGEQFHLVVGHAPNYALGQVDADLLLAGHTHGGQVRLPLIGTLMTLSQIPRSWAAGLTELSGGRRLLVSRGVGMERDRAARIRFLCRPELMVIDLVPTRD